MPEQFSIENHVREDVSSVPPQGGYVAKRCPVVAQNYTLLPGDPIQPNAFTQRLFDRGNEHEANIFHALAKLGATVISEEDDEARIRGTLLAVERGDVIIAGGQLPTDLRNKRAGKPDLLVASRSGGYRAGDVKSHLTRSKSRTPFPWTVSTLDAPQRESAVVDTGSCARKHEGDLLQLAHYQRMLEGCGLAADDGSFGAIIGTEGVIVWYDLDAQVFSTASSGGLRKKRSTLERYDFEFGFRLDVIARALNHVKGEATGLLPPVRIPECDRCEWHDVCLEALSKEDGDISLLPGIGYKEWKQHSQRGIRDRAQLAALDANDSRYEDWELPDLQENIDQARAWVGQDAFYLRDGVQDFELPRAPVEIDFDVESFEGQVYLWGALRTDEQGSEFVAVASWPELDELATFRTFWDWLQSQRASHELLVFHYSEYERTQLTRLAKQVGLEGEVQEFLASGACRDLHKLVKSQLITGTGMGLKTLAPLAGFQWSVEDPGGAESMMHFEHAAASGHPLAEESRRWLLEYNRNDVEATLALREFLRAQPPKSLPRPQP